MNNSILDLIKNRIYLNSHYVSFNVPYFYILYTFVLFYNFISSVFNSKLSVYWPRPTIKLHPRVRVPFIGINGRIKVPPKRTERNIFLAHYPSLGYCLSFLFFFFFIELFVSRSSFPFVVFYKIIRRLNR